MTVFVVEISVHHVRFRPRKNYVARNVSFSWNEFLFEKGDKSAFYRISDLKIFTIFTGKRPYWRSLIVKVAGLAWKKSLSQVFSSEFCQITQSSFSRKPKG